MARLTQAKIAHALNAQGGNVSAAARALGVARSSVYRHIEQSPALAQQVIDAREEVVDIAESELKQQVRDGNITAIIFTLKTLGKSRGYVERTEHTGADGGAVRIQWVDALSDDDDTGIGADQLPDAR